MLDVKKLFESINLSEDTSIKLLKRNIKNEFQKGRSISSTDI